MVLTLHNLLSSVSIMIHFGFYYERFISVEEVNFILLLLTNQKDKKIKTLTDPAELNEDAVFYATVEQRSDILTIIFTLLKVWLYCRMI